MSENASGKSRLYFLAGGLLAAGIAVGYFTMDRGDRGDAGSSPSVSRDAGENGGTSPELGVDNTASISETIEQD